MLGSINNNDAAIGAFQQVNQEKTAPVASKPDPSPQPSNDNTSTVSISQEAKDLLKAEVNPPQQATLHSGTDNGDKPK